MVEHNLLALVAYRVGEVREAKGKAGKITVGKKLQWDADNLEATNCPEADQFMTKTYREGCVLNG